MKIHTIVINICSLLILVNRIKPFILLIYVEIIAETVIIYNSFIKFLTNRSPCFVYFKLPILCSAVYVFVTYELKCRFHKNQIILIIISPQIKRM